MNEITYKNKKIKLPFPDADYSDQPLELETVQNPLSGESIAMPKFAVAVYDVTTGSNHLAEAEDHKLGMGASKHWPTVRKGLDWFRRYFAMVDSCAGDAWLTSIVNFFIALLSVFQIYNLIF